MAVKQQFCQSVFKTATERHYCVLAEGHNGSHTSTMLQWDTPPKSNGTQQNWDSPSSLTGGGGVIASQEMRHTFPSGAQRSAEKPRYDLIPQCALKRIAERFQVGLKYGEHNYKKGLPFDDTLNHIIDHLLSYKERRKTYLQGQPPQDPLSIETLEEYMKRTEPDGDDLGGAAWGCVALMWLEENGKLL